MKLFALFTVALAQEGAPGDGSRAMSLDKKISNAKVKCNYYMEKALVCNPPSSKISKYNHRIEKVLLDAKFHLESGKCDKNAPVPGPYSRKRRQAGDDLFSADEEFTALEQEIEQFGGKGKYGSMANPDQLERLKGVCEKFANASLADDSLADCPKLGAWQKRMAHLLLDLDRMEAVCVKQESAATGGGSYPTQPPTTEDPYAMETTTALYTDGYPTTTSYYPTTTTTTTTKYVGNKNKNKKNKKKN
ncbi:Oidioi.mRNA.OKI2018_I69.XSR.g15209.t1.cds [Oikopleura dioica]|uniref:Oidioi.mRNA.OKI2018_I69.XSR.g15209.t1.cds n=1 Tax=Oikopleura dioica TaxID=34765 RepID=A0ABN7SCK6_OIKDI|nr:Oidioi.mRNA.OKI2018_I69.XSR.g15209.t1.cds [Oikopleura dioica]